jgi:hypothetical protein
LAFPSEEEQETALKRVASERDYVTRFKSLFYACRHPKTAAHF